MQPINYMQGYQNPLESILNQVKMYQDFSQNANVLQSQREQNRITTAHNDRRIQAMNELQGVDFNDENKLREWAGRYGDLEYGKGLNDYLGRLDEQAKKAEIGRVSQVYSLLKNGKDDVAIADLEQQALAYENAGDKANANGARQMAQLIRADRNSALMNVGMAYAHLVPKDTMANYKDFVNAQTPNVQYQNMGGYGQAVITDPITGEVRTQNMGDYTQSPDNYADNLTKENIAQWSNQNAQDVAHINGGYNLQERQMQEAGANAREQAKLELQSKLAQQEAMIKANEVKPMEAGGKMWLVRADGQHRPMLDANGQHLSASGGKVSDGDKKAVREAEEQIVTTQNSLNRFNKVINDLESGKLNLGVIENAFHIGRNKAGFANEASLAYADMDATIKDAVNQVLMLAKGTQTEGDAQRAKETILSAPLTDNKVVLQALYRLREIANKTIALKQKQINDVYGGAYAPITQPQPTTNQPQQPTSYASMRLN